MLSCKTRTHELAHSSKTHLYLPPDELMTRRFKRFVELLLMLLASNFYDDFDLLATRQSREEQFGFINRTSFLFTRLNQQALQCLRIVIGAHGQLTDLYLVHVSVQPCSLVVDVSDTCATVRDHLGQRSYAARTVRH